MTDLDLTSVTKLAETILKPKSTAQVHPVDLVHGVIVDFGPNSLTCVLYGASGDNEELGVDSVEDNTPATGVRFLETYDPKIGDNVWILKQGGNMICLGKVRYAPEELEQFIRVGIDEGYDFNAGWANYENGYAGLRYWMDPDGLVHVEGRVKYTAGTPARGAYIHNWVGEESDHPGPGTYWGSPFGIAFTAVRYDDVSGAQPFGIWVDDTAIGLDGDNIGEASAATYIDLSGIVFPSKVAWYDRGLRHEYMRMRPQTNNLLVGWSSDTLSPSSTPMVWKRWDGMCISKGVLEYFGSSLANDRVIAGVPESALRTQYGAVFQAHGRLSGSQHRVAHLNVRAQESVIFMPTMASDVDENLSFEGKIWWSDSSEEAWQPMEYLNGWGSYGSNSTLGMSGTYPSPSWYIDQYGVCHLRGIIGDQGGAATKANGLVMALLPEECKPASDEKIAFFSGSLTMSRLAIHPTDPTYPDKCAIIIDDATPTAAQYILYGISWRTRIEKFSDSIPEEGEVT